MKVTSEKGADVSAGYTKPCLAQLENMLQELRRCEERKRQQGVESASVAAKQKLLYDQLLQTKDELAATQASKAKLCEEIGTLKQTKDHQAKQLSKYKLDLQAARESHAAMTKKMGELETSTWTIKQQYIRSLASRIKTSALVLQQLNAKNGTTFSARISETSSEREQDKPNKRKRIMEDNEKQLEAEGGDKPKQAGIPANIESGSRQQQSHNVVVEQVTAAKIKLGVAVTDHHESLSSDETREQNSDHAEAERQITELQSQLATLESKYSALKDKYKALERKHDKALIDNKTSAQEIEAKNSKIEELMQVLEISRSKQQPSPDRCSSTTDVAKEATEGRVKMLEENVAQMNAYADQLEMVIGQCPSCTEKLQNGSTQDSISNNAE
ncbi:hypothetical protein GN244_ATG20018 [Phytophthora infestans]|uniref:Uncharacterized protein n=1 Tax=Phytophthora infestans TaxID=4787 RepID=A0A833W4I4_PHYIN|nr:hypothetical protein GN244_ATG20018 [Phytophthora infestans]KAF4137278.1 hypothetical protein GN958_ATG13541 [Phytophthora infestans]